MLPPVAVSLVPNEDSWSELAKQFLRRDSLLGQRGRHSRRKKKGGHPEGPPAAEGEQVPPPQAERRARQSRVLGDG